MPATTFDQLLTNRSSIRSFTSDPVRPEDLLAICEAARQAPSACNSQTWRFIVSTEMETIRRICRKAMRPVIRNKWLEQAPALIVGCSKLDIIANRMGTKITGVEYFQIDLGIAMTHMVLKATDLGLGTCWIGWFKENKVKEIFEIPQNIKVSAMLALGHPTAAPSRKTGRKPIQKIVFSQKWGQAIDIE